ncbi:hypothetical protein AU255_05595 [Methyloprofundus sedimenti]|uniref:Uncharacterized protein n=1 Tax=Methyloprofundus sedimenti TaxID=1420851 RepID=A0A1V8M735_9GAMM|nr:hypothetical protein [Methyloprofundus sedimenti]OQK17357.1 hypothetical protein AU255_05595 [Methyloprofundus sedimenti]
MKKNNIKKGIFTALLLASPFVTAGTQYPAADFQPKVVYQDESYQHQSSESSNATSNSSSSEKSKADANYPAATFQPEVLYIDKDYKHNAGSIPSKSVPLKKSTEKVAYAAEENKAVAEESSMNPLFAIVVLGVAFFLYSKQSKGTAKPKKTVVSRRQTHSGNFRNANGDSGVAKYLQNKVPKLSSVDKYLQANQSAPKSGVAKYVARRVVAAKQAASEKVTGVEKYMRNQNRG